VARWEHKTRKLSKAFGSPRLACYTLGGAILLLNILRSHWHHFTQAMLSQPRMQSLDNPAAYHVGLALLGVGGVFVFSSFLALGFTGTFLGDYFGILKEARVTMFPFSVLDNPMYWGSTAIYLGWAIVGSPTQVLLQTSLPAHPPFLSLPLPTLTQQGCSQAFPAHLSPAWGPTDRASCWPKQPSVWEPQKARGAGIPGAPARQPE
ncbi:hypothetical protein FD755_021088, partial [Muntiacus reevesi]